MTVHSIPPRPPEQRAQPPRSATFAQQAAFTVTDLARILGLITGLDMAAARLIRWCRR